MAKATLDPIITDLLGPLAHIVATTTHGEPTLRTKYLEPGGTPAQIYFRKKFREVDTAYSLIPQPDKDIWRSRAKTLRCSPYTLWMRVNLHRAYINLTLLPLPP